VCASAFVLLLVAVLIKAFQSQRFALWWELLALPIAGLILAAIGRSQIRNSEGTRTGGRLASVSWWVCVLGGVGFAAYIYANSMALEMESGKFADQMFRDLQAGRYREAFENHLVPPEERGRVPASSSEEVFETAYVPSGYTAFRNHEVVRLFARNGQATQFERVRIKESGQEPAGLFATHIYRITCPEGIFETQVKTVAAEARKGGKPLWRIPAQPVPSFTPLDVVQLSQYGRVSSELSQEGEQFLKGWMGRLGAGHRAWVESLTTPYENQVRVATAMNWLAAMGGELAWLIPASPVDLPPDRAAAWEERERQAAKSEDPHTARADLPFDDLLGSGFFRRDQAGAPIPEEKLRLLRELWRPPHQPNLMPADYHVASLDNSPPLAPRIIFKPDRVTLIYAANLYVEKGVLHVRCAVAAECTDPAVLAVVNAARDRGVDAKDDGSVTLKSLPPRDWRVIWLQSDMEPLVPSGPGVPGGR
ncbi:MAG TPA: hypothetical protein VGI99_15105, partial [Gemmataceae bacterium]